ncbi:type-4 ice-structuring protein [Gadus morhua]|uniref:Type-4 ice-structuring protein n=1 Tax=Gadus morhua TaxID=8049 RepID=AFP4_GADMO|nr:type-4 ice-structuring protein [Gadus morhua]Q56TU0.1 RecName: Full=Type-4 ice-structuring protein; AltName: Full=Antifreeze protein type IV; Flags: Precursor [Gadus morhua]AAT95404.1 antifreeze protein [Gadus morhua]
MKYTLIAAIVVLALAQGTLAVEQSPELEKMAQFFEGMKTELMATVQKVSESLQSQTIIEDGRTQLEPIMTQIQEHLAPLATSVQEKVTPLAEDMQQKLKPYVDEFQSELESVLRKLLDQAKAITQ